MAERDKNKMIEDLLNRMEEIRVNRRFYEDKCKTLEQENEKLKNAIKAELKRCGGIVPILNEVLNDIKKYKGRNSSWFEDRKESGTF